MIITIIDFFSIYDQRYTSFCFRNLSSNSIVIFHHFDIKEHGAKKFKTFNALQKYVKRNDESKKVVTVSKYWENYLTQTHNLKNVKTIYNSFDIKKYEKVDMDKVSFLKKYNLDSKPIIYIGKNSISKTLFTYNNLKQLKGKYNIITSGLTKEFDGPIHLQLDYNDYINLLNFADITILLTNFKEGWNRIAHESIISKTPVISLIDSGGFDELMQMTNQIQIKINEIDNIEKIQEATSLDMDESRKILKKFDLNYFKNEWLETIKQNYR